GGHGQVSSRGSGQVSRFSLALLRRVCCPGGHVTPITPPVSGSSRGAGQVLGHPGGQAEFQVFLLPSCGEYVALEGMSRRLRLQYPDAIYHLMARGNGRQDIVCDDVDRDRLLHPLGRTAVRCSWIIYAFAIMSNHLHIVLKTPQPNFGRGMQAFLSAYANGWS